MARIAAQERAYYYPTPHDVVADVVGSLAPRNSVTSVLDPCAGDGRAIRALAEKFGTTQSRTYAVEFDGERATGLGEFANVLQGDAFRLQIDPESAGVGVLWLNPPYDAEGGRRVEEKWLARHWEMLSPGGALVLVVPHYALPACRELLASGSARVRVARFPDPEWEVYRQVVVIAEKGPPGAGIGAALDLAAREPLSLRTTRELDEFEFDGWGIGLRPWALQEFDPDALAATFRPWEYARGHRDLPIPGMVGELGTNLVAKEVFRSIIPAGVPHVAAAIAAGVFDGAVVEPDDPRSGLPLLAVRGRYEREYVPIERRYNRDGEHVATVEQQVPRLSIAALDLTTGRLFDLERTADDRYDPDEPGEHPLARFSGGDLLNYYGESLGAELVARVRPVFDPATDDEPVTTFARRPFAAQLVRIKACLRFLRSGARGCSVAGEPGTGKTTISLIVAGSLLNGRGRVLVMAPAHLVYEWTHNQVPAILGDSAVVSELRTVADVDAWLDGEPDRLSVGVMARSRAKLGHGRDGLARCARCGTVPPADAATNARRRAHCRAEIHEPAVVGGVADPTALLVVRLARALGRVLPTSEIVRRFAPPGARFAVPPGVARTKRGRALQARMADRPGRPIRSAWGELETACVALLRESRPGSDEVVLEIANATGSDEFRAALVARAYPLTLRWPHGEGARRTLRRVLGASVGDARGELIKSWTEFDERNGVDGAPWRYANPWHGAVSYGRHGDESHALLDSALTTLSKAAVWRTRECGEALYEAVPAPRRFPLMRYLFRRAGRRVGFAISDESHEGANPNTAQSQANELLYGLRDARILPMTGTSSNGFARSLFPVLWALPESGVRERFTHGNAHAFQEQYGFNTRVVDFVDGAGRQVEFGAVSNAKRRTRALSRAAPGVVPTAILRHFLPSTVAITLDDLAGDVDLPPCEERTITVEPAPEQLDRWRAGLVALRDQLKADRRTERDRALLGQLAQYPIALDLITGDTGNAENGSYVIDYPDRFNRDVVHVVPPGDPSVVLPKERALVDYVTTNVAAGEPVIVGVWSAGTARRGPCTLPERLARLVSQAGVRVAHLKSTAVPPDKRIRWIQENVVDAGVECLVVQPRAIETGINNLTYFTRVALYHGTGNRPDTYRQTRGRVHRPGTTRPTEIASFVYGDTLQELSHRWLMDKVAASAATDGVDPTASLRAVGADDEDTLIVHSYAAALLRAIS